MAVDTKRSTQVPVGQTLHEMNDIDAAWSFLNKSHNADDVSNVDIKALRRKVDWRIVPLMFGCYTLQFLDKVILNVSRFQPYFVSPS